MNGPRTAMSINDISCGRMSAHGEVCTLLEAIIMVVGEVEDAQNERKLEKWIKESIKHKTINNKLFPLFI